MVMSFNKFINEQLGSEEEFLKDLAIKLIEKIRTSRDHESEEYSEHSGMEFTTPFAFDLNLFVRRDSDADFKQDEHFKNLPWEELNYSEYGYAIDANTHFNHRELSYPSITFHLIIDPRQEPHLYSKLFTRMFDILVHEATHLEQVGQGREPFNQMPSNPKKRELAKKSYEYFLLDDEVESMVNGMYVSSLEQKKPLDQVFNDYLKPYLVSQYITPTEYQKVMKRWVTQAIENYPDAHFSPQVDKIINSI